ncbi:hypothetical protein H8356DRAFT_1295285 [Neocallimastix lanati (nom. inval.)]|uniref:Uncharacterized protein n=1 Tax=Neocallimastix californiae TaxID=1754190 RepID=A0A1Y2DJC5_9FUNG|nr:hypothetical protein H8356DRAFT_1295285 [Neocallimastix sp. JGI-2020a]ORY59358.1 hypothetical protein LY90DRAFT_506026 [Neocallimastix californiae]|eukprot:ORY59358.1 hypothetical protein LY90DRAFT_506026 [Neocallimastix californiae]
MEENLIIDIIPKFMYRNKCKSFIILNDKKEILKYDSSHNHPEKEYDVSLSIMKHKIKDGIEKIKLFKEYNDDIFVDAISNLPFIKPEYIFDIYVIIKIKSIKNNYCQFLKFLEYFYKICLVGYEMKIWNYYNNTEHITNNASESLNSYLNNLFPTKPSYFELIDKLNELEHLSYYDFQRKIRGIIKKKSNK